MALIANLTQETSTSSGAGNFTLVPANGYNSFASSFGTGSTPDVFVYYITDPINNLNEWGYGHMADATTLVRDTVKGGSNGTDLVNFGSGQKIVVNDLLAELQGMVQTITGLNTDNSDPQNPVVQISVDNTTITGSGTPSDPLQASIPSVPVTSVFGRMGAVTAESGDYDASLIPYDGSSPTTVTVGGLAAGAAIAGESIQAILQSILVPYINPSFSSFAMVGQASPIEVGATISGNKSFSFGFNTPANVTASSLAILDVTNSTTLASGLSLTSPESANVGSVQLTASGSHSWAGRATNTQAVTFNSANFTVAWQWKRYNGTNSAATLTAAQIQALATSALAANELGTYSFVANDYKYFAWPDSFGSPTASTGFKDTSTGLAVAMADVTDNAAYSNVQNGWSYALVSVTNSNSVTTNYRVYRTKNILSGSINIQVS